MDKKLFIETTKKAFPQYQDMRFAMMLITYVTLICPGSHHKTLPLTSN